MGQGGLGGVGELSRALEERQDYADRRMHSRWETGPGNVHGMCWE